MKLLTCRKHINCFYVFGLHKRELKVISVPASIAFFPVKFCHLMTAISTYSGESSIARHFRFVCSLAMIVVPDPENGSYTISHGFELFTIGFIIHSTGFCVECPVLFCTTSIFHTVVCLRPPLHLPDFHSSTVVAVFLYLCSDFRIEWK